MNAKSLLLTLAATFGGLLPLTAAVQHKTVEYKAGDTVCEGYLAFDDAAQGDRPGVLVVHDWMGVSDHTRSVCDDLAKLGYVAFAADIYGKGVRPADAKAAGGLAGKYKSDRALLRARAAAGFEQLKAAPHVQAGQARRDRLLLRRHHGARAGALRAPISPPSSPSTAASIRPLRPMARTSRRTCWCCTARTIPS